VDDVTGSEEEGTTERDGRNVATESTGQLDKKI